MPRRRIQRAPRSAASLLLTVLIILIYYGWRYYKHHPHPAVNSNPTQAPYVGSPNLLLGRPIFDPPLPPEQDYLMDKGTYVLSYNNAKGTPNWVSWRLTTADLGNAKRKQLFDPDDMLPPGFTRITHRDYTSSGFDRGHMCPHSDRASSEAASFSTFIMTNIIPQAPNVNERAWEQMEDYCRTLTKQHHRLYIISGPAGEGGTGSRGFRKTIANGKVVVPAACWKIVVVVDDSAAADLAAINAQTRVIAVDMPNDNSVGDTWGQYRTTVATIEEATHLRFFANLSPEVAGALRTKLDQAPLPSPLHYSRQ